MDKREDRIINIKPKKKTKEEIDKEYKEAIEQSIKEFDELIKKEVNKIG